MRYAQRGGYTPAEQQRRELLWLEAAGRFARGDGISEIEHELRVTEGSVRGWRRAWQAPVTGSAPASAVSVLFRSHGASAASQVLPLGDKVFSTQNTSLV